ncbi:MAG: hypothetical protein FWF29_09675, partial [Treponema sp.]|nr:hypothetical protein [Treponema sp.]
MRSLFRNNFWFTVIAAGIAAITCKAPVGLGSSVDISAPVVSINTENGRPGPGAFISGNTAIYISAEDDSGVAYVTVTYSGLNSADGSSKSLTVNAVRNPDHGLYVSNVDTTAFQDGTLTVIVTAADTTGKKTVTPDLVFTVKNGPPTVTMQIPRPKTLLGDLVNIDPYPAVVSDNYLMGVFEDLAGVAPGFPLLKFWEADKPEPAVFSENAGWENVGAYAVPNGGEKDGWVLADEGYAENVRGERGGSFRYYLRERNPDGTPHAIETGNMLKPDILYNLKVYVEDINGTPLSWPGDAYPNAPEFMTVKLEATGFPPIVTITSPPYDKLYHRGEFTIEADAAPQGDLDTYIAEMSIEVSGRSPSNSAARPAVVLSRWTSPDNLGVNMPVSFTVSPGAVYYCPGESSPAIAVASESDVPLTAYSYVVFSDGNFNFTVTATGDAGSRGAAPLSLYIDRMPPKTAVTGVTPWFSIDDPQATQAQDAPNNSVNHGDLDNYGNFIPTQGPDPYRRWTVNSSISIGVSSTDNRGNALDPLNNNYMKFKYLFLKDADINESDFIIWRFSNPKGTFGEYLYALDSAEFFEATRDNPLLPPPPDHPVVFVEGSDGAYTLTLQTHKFDARPQYRLWFYIVAMDNAGNINYQKILLNVDQDTDSPRIVFGNMSADTYTFLDDKFPIRLTITDDDGLDPASIQYRYAQSPDDRDEARWKPLAGELSIDGLVYTVNGLTLLHIACDLLGHTFPGNPPHIMDSEHKAALGPEELRKYIEVRASDDPGKKVYPATDGAQTGNSGWMPFTMDLTYPQIDVTISDYYGNLFIMPEDIRSPTDPFGAPRKDGAYSEMIFAWGDIIEQNLDTITIKIDGGIDLATGNSSLTVINTITDIPVLSAPPAGNDFAVWRLSAGNPSFRWRVPMAELFNSLEDGSHTFEISFTDKVPQTTTMSLAFYKDSDGPRIGLINPGAKLYLDDAAIENLSQTQIDALAATNSIKDAQARIIGTFTDNFSAVFAPSNSGIPNTGYWYRMDFVDTAAKQAVNGNWQWVNIPDSDITDNKPVSWQITLPEGMPDGMYRLSL